MVNDKELIPEEEQSNFDEGADEEVYSSEGRDKLVEEDEISPWEAAFMEGADNDGQQAKCRKCGKMLQRSELIIEKVVDGELYRFCSDKCSDEFDKK